MSVEDYFIEPQETERCTVDGRWYGIGSCWVAPHIYYNADLFAAEGIEPPSNDPDEAWTWDQFVEAGRVFTKDANGNHPGDSGFDIENVDTWGIHWNYPNTTVNAAAVNINGASWIDPETLRIDLDSPEGIEAMQKLADLMLVDQVMPKSCAFEGLGMTNTQMLERQACHGHRGFVGIGLDEEHECHAGYSRAAQDEPGRHQYAGPSSFCHERQQASGRGMAMGAFPCHSLLSIAVLPYRSLAAQPDGANDREGLTEWMAKAWIPPTITRSPQSICPAMARCSTCRSVIRASPQS